MTDRFDSPDSSDPDELASAYLDGEAALDELEQVEADIDLLRRVERFGTVRDRLTVEAPPASVLDAQVAAALDHFGEVPASAIVTDLAERRRPWSQRVPLGAVAAAIVVVALGIGVATQATRDTDSADMAAGTAADAEIVEDSGRAGLDQNDASGGGSAFGSAGDLAPDSAESLPATDGSGMLRQAFADDEALADYVRRQLQETSSEPANDDTGSTGGSTGGGAAPEAGDGTAGRSSDPCDAVRVAAVDPAQVRVVVPIVLGDDDATAVGYTDGDGVDRLVVVRDATCEVTLRREL